MKAIAFPASVKPNKRKIIEIENAPTMPAPIWSGLNNTPRLNTFMTIGNEEIVIKINAPAIIVASI